MGKKFIIFVVCLVTVCSVWELNDRLTYEGFKVAVESVDGEVDMFVNDLVAFSAFGHAISNYDPSISGKTVFINPANEKMLWIVNLEGLPEPFVFATEEKARQMYNILEPIMTGSPIDAAGWTHFGFYLIVGVVVFAVQTIFDIFSVAWSLIEACLYLLGLANL